MKDFEENTWRKALGSPSPAALCSEAPPGSPPSLVEMVWVTASPSCLEVPRHVFGGNEIWGWVLLED